ncbi:unnamed protein product [Miscanthus lutarioriparius]|uniref:non-specific serine/threonine protein kinase n=1 Tax=Miscanthus lutarioriparius TaxID=422564 RepID=A0A811N1K6_9POAL|nr:unnamed protein product [Miscanthus lutarioriparius]
MGPLPCLFLVLVSSSLSLALVPRAAAYSEYSCNGTTGNFTSGSAFAANLARLVAALPGNASSSASLFASASVGAAPADTAYGLALCRGDVADPRVCSACLADAFARLRRLCGGDRDATFYADLCTARYSGGDFLARPDDNSPVINALDVNGSTYYGWDARNATSRTLFLSLVGTLFSEMAMYAAYNSSAARMFASAAMYVNPQLPTVYGFVQCTPDLSRAQCWDCFQVLQDQNRRWYDGREGGRILGVRCSFRYEAYHFFQGMPEVRIGLKSDPSSSSAPESQESNHKVVLIVALVVSITVFSAMVSVGLVMIRARRKRTEKKRKPQLEAQSRNSSATEDALKLWRIEESSSEFTLYDFPELAAATGGFSDENLLGRGGFGPVYKGKMADGAEVAVKRLAAHSGQGLEEFKNEIQLIAKLQHTNLVRLVGCCVQEEEKLLAYEYMPNRSLNFFIFDQQRGPLLDWEKRRRIIDGIVQGLLYLHKHSRVRIIHRDLKASNILLDKDLNPKISDFGMARIFGSNMTEANTNRVVGTYGYMAPEYASEGIFSVKSDVYSFGVLLLEIVSGKRNSGHHHHYGDFVNLLGYAWQLWREGRVFELIDPTLGECGDVATIVRCVKVALLCVQDSAADRPTMADVTTMLQATGPLPDPKRPPHFSLRVATAATSSSDDDGGSGLRTRTRTQCTTSCSTNDLTITSIHEGR